MDVIVKNGASQLDALTDRLWEQWIATRQVDVSNVAEHVDAFDRSIHVLLAKPSETALPECLKTRSLNAIIEDLPIKVVDEPLGRLSRGIKIGGIIVGVIFGNPILASACFKKLIHDTFHHMLVSGIKALITGGRSKSGRGRKYIAQPQHDLHQDDPEQLLWSWQEDVVRRQPEAAVTTTRREAAAKQAQQDEAARKRGEGVEQEQRETAARAPEGAAMSPAGAGGQGRDGSP